MEEERTGGSHLARNSAIAVGIVVVILVAFLATRGTSTKSSGRIVGQAAPEVVGQTLDGSTFNLANHLGEWVVVNFFATWCVPCRLENPQLQQFVTEHRDDPVTVVSVAFSDDAEAIRSYWEKEKNQWPVISSSTGAIALNWGVTGVPESYLVAPNGLVVTGFTGGVTAAALDEAIENAGGMAVAVSS